MHTKSASLQWSWVLAGLELLVGSRPHFSIISITHANLFKGLMLKNLFCDGANWHVAWILNLLRDWCTVQDFPSFSLSSAVNSLGGYDDWASFLAIYVNEMSLGIYEIVTLQKDDIARRQVILCSACLLTSKEKYYVASPPPDIGMSQSIGYSSPPDRVGGQEKMAKWSWNTQSILAEPSWASLKPS